MRRELALAAAMALALATTTGNARADAPSLDPLVFVVDPHMGMETTARTADGLTRVLQRYEDALPARILPGDGRAARAARVIGRALQLVFVDVPLAQLSADVVHEAGGHGARGRELDVPASYDFRLPSVYRLLLETRDGESYSAATTFDANGPLQGDRALLLTTGGVEANLSTARWITTRMVRDGGRLEKGDALVLVFSKLSYVRDFVDVPDDGGGTNDVRGYVNELLAASNGWRPSDRARIEHRIEAGYLLNLLDPTLLYAAFTAVDAGIVRGARASRIPLPTVGGTILHPTPRFVPAPFGVENGLGVVLGRGGRVLDLHGRVGTTGLFASQALGLRALGFSVHPRLVLGGELDVWRQPELLLGERFVFDRPTRAGAGAALHADLRVAGPVGLTAKLGLKSAGFVPAQPASAGTYGYVGLSMQAF